MTTLTYQDAYAILAEYVARNIPLDDNFHNIFEDLLTNIVTESGGSMDDEEFVNTVGDQLAQGINKNGLERRAYLEAQNA